MRDSHDTRDSDASDGLTFTRRAAMAMLGAGALAGGSGVAAAQEGDGNGNSPTRKWNQHIDAQDRDLRNVGAFDAGEATLGNVRTAARDADVIVWKDDEGVFHADSVDETVASGEDVIEVTQAAATASPGTGTGRRRSQSSRRAPSARLTTSGRSNCRATPSSTCRRRCTSKAEGRNRRSSRSE